MNASSPSEPASCGTGHGAGASVAPGGSLRQLVLHSAGYLAGREVIGMVVRLGGAVVVMRAMGPARYGIFTGAAAFVLFASVVAQMGAEVYLIRVPEAPSRRKYDEAFTFLLVTSCLITGLGLLLTVPLGHLLRPVGVLVPLRVLLLVVPLNVLWAPAQACIERQFGYRRMGILELGGDIVLYAVAAPLAVLGWGVWSLVVGYFAWQGWLFFGGLAFSGLRPRLAWSRQTSRELLRHGSSYSLITWAGRAVQLVVALVVGTFAGAAGVGYVNFAQRLVTTLSVTKRGVFRLGMVAVSRARAGGTERLARALEEGSFLVVVAAVAPFAAFGLVARWVIPLVFGIAWATAVPLYVAMAVASCLGVLMLVQSTVLLAMGENLQAAAGTLSQLGIVTVGSLLLVPRFGAIGFGYASILALAATAVTHRYMARVAPMGYRRLFLPIVALLPPVVASVLPFPVSLVTVVPAAILALLPSTRREAHLLVGVVRATLARRSGVAGAAGTRDAEPSSTAEGSAPGGGRAATMQVPTVVAGAGSGRRAVAGVDRQRVSDARSVLGPPALHPRAGPDLRDAARVGGQASPRASEPFWALPPDAVTGASDLDVMLARAGRLLGGARRSGWPLMLAAFELSPGLRGARVDAATVREALDALRADLRFDDPVAHAGPSTFVVATALAPGAADGCEVAAHLAASVSARLRAAPRAETVALDWSYVVTTAGSADEVDDLLRRAVDGLRAAR